MEMMLARDTLNWPQVHLQTSLRQVKTELTSLLLGCFEWAPTNWMWGYNHERPNMALGGITPMQRFAMAAWRAAGFFVTTTCRWFIAFLAVILLLLSICATYCFATKRLHPGCKRRNLDQSSILDLFLGIWLCRT
jgi:hypothetical protein